MKAYKIEGIVLKRRNLGEADRILTVFSKEEGKIQVKAPGVRRISSRRSAHIELLNFSKLTLNGNFKSFMPIVTEAETLESFSSIKNSLNKVGYAYYICELINGLCPENQENKNVFFHLKSALSNLSSFSDIKDTVKSFEKNLLAELGFWSELKLLDTQDSKGIMERLLEKRLKTVKMMPLFAS